MEQLVEVARTLREEHDFRGYIHLKTIPDAEPELIAQAGRYADRAVDQHRAADRGGPEAPRAREGRRRHPTRDGAACGCASTRRRTRGDAQAAPRFAPAGQIDADDRRRRRAPTTRRSSARSADALRRLRPEARLLLGLQPDPRRQPRRCRSSAPPLHARAPALPGRLADALLRLRRRGDRGRRGATACSTSTIDPKLAWALQHRERFPVDVNRRRARAAAARARPRHAERSSGSSPRAAIATLRLDDLGRLTRRRWPSCGPSSSPPTTGRRRLLDRRRPARPARARPSSSSCSPEPPPERRPCTTSRSPGRTISRAGALPRARLIAAGAAPGSVVWRTGEDRRAVRRRRRRLPRRIVRGAARPSCDLSSDVDLPPRPGALRSALPCCSGASPRASATLLEIAADPLVHRLARHAPRRCGATSTRCTPSCASAEVETDDGERFVAWFEPEHHILRRAAPFFVGRFAAHALVDPDAGGLDPLGRRGARLRGRRDARRTRPPPMRSRTGGGPTTRAIFNPARAQSRARCAPRCRGSTGATCPRPR